MVTRRVREAIEKDVLRSDAQRPPARLGAVVTTTILLLVVPAPAAARHGELPNRIPEPAPYDTTEAHDFRPPYGPAFESGSPQVCAGCHQRIFEEWNGSMMSNAWRDPAWRAAFLLIARLVATDGNCDVPNPPDGSKRSQLNPFANDDCSSTFDLGTARHTTSGSGSLLDGFCSRCHMPANYIDAVKPRNVALDPETGLEHGLVDPDFDPTSSRGTERAFATFAGRNDEAGKLGITCTFCHTIRETRNTPFHNHGESEERVATLPGSSDRFDPADANNPTLGYAVGAGAYRVSPRALLEPERFGPLARVQPEQGLDAYLSAAFGIDVPAQSSTFEGSIHRGSYEVLFERAEMCGTCHDVTNPLTVMNSKGRWVGGFPIERTYSEWASSRYAERPGNRHFDPAFKRDCQSCHMQQHFGRPGTAQTLFDANGPLAPLTGRPAKDGPERPIYFSHHFVGGNSYSTALIGANVAENGKAARYPELSAYSFSSADPKSPYYNAYFDNVGDSTPTHHARMAWDRLRHALELELTVPRWSAADQSSPVRIRVTNSGTGHNFPTGFPEGRNAWVALRATDLASGSELMIEDSFWRRRSLGVGYLTDHDLVDPNFPDCHWKLPAGSPDPYAWQFRAVASLGDGCPTLELPYATPLNLVVNGQGLPIDDNTRPIDRANPSALPRFSDRDGDGDLYDDAFLLDTRLRPLPHPGAELTLDRYSVVIPPGTRGPVAVTALVYYQSMEAIAAKKLLGNLADTDLDHVLEPCVLRGPCDGRVPHREPAVVEGAPPVPTRVTSAVINIDGVEDTTPPEFTFYPAHFQTSVHRDVVPKLTLSEPATGVDRESFTLTDANGARVPASVAQIDDTTFALFPDQVFLEASRGYVAEFSGRLCDLNHNCTTRRFSFGFTVADGELGSGDTRPPARPSAAAAATQARIMPPLAPGSEFKLVILALIAAATACVFGAVYEARRARLARLMLR